MINKKHDLNKKLTEEKMRKIEFTLLNHFVVSMRINGAMLYEFILIMIKHCLQQKKSVKNILSMKVNFQ